MQAPEQQRRIHIQVLEGGGAGAGPPGGAEACAQVLSNRKCKVNAGDLCGGQLGRVWLQAVLIMRQQRSKQLNPQRQPTWVILRLCGIHQQQRRQHILPVHGPAGGGAGGG